MRLELGDLLEALIATGELAEAEAILEDWEPRARSLDRAWALAVLGRCRGLELAARGDLEGAFASLERALAEHARITDPFQHARTLLAFGKTQRRAKKRGSPAPRSKTRSHASSDSASRCGPSRHAPSSHASAVARAPTT